MSQIWSTPVAEKIVQELCDCFQMGPIVDLDGRELRLLEEELVARLDGRRLKATIMIRSIANPIRECCYVLRKSMASIWDRSIMIGDKDSDMQAARKAGVGIRCHYLAGADEAMRSAAATHKIRALREGILLLSQSVATRGDA